MKKLMFLVICSLLVFGQISAQFKLNTNPKDPNRLPNGETEVGIVLSHNSPRITINDANGHLTTNYLPAGVLVIVNKETRIANWIAICGNDNLTKNWRPEGKVIYFDKPNSYQFACEDMLKGLEAKLDNIQKGVDKLLRRPSLQEALRLSSTTSTSFNNNCWTDGKTITTISAAGVGAVVGGYGFRTTHTSVVVIPGIRLQSGDGTIIFGPDKTEIRTHKEFNVGAAVVCGLASGVINYLLNCYVF